MLFFVPSCFRTLAAKFVVVSSVIATYNGYHYNLVTVYKYADDTASLAGNENEISELISKINEVGKQLGKTIIIKKTKAMAVSTKPHSSKINIFINRQHIGQVKSYMYIGNLIPEDGRSEKEIKRRLIIARTTFTNTRTLLSCRGINLKTREAMKCYVWPTLFYRAENGQLQNHFCPDLMPLRYGYIAVLNISWTNKITNEEVLRRTGKDRELVRIFKTRKIQYLGHLHLIEGKIEGRRSRGRPEHTRTTDITYTTKAKESH